MVGGFAVESETGAGWLSLAICRVLAMMVRLYHLKNFGGW